MPRPSQLPCRTFATGTPPERHRGARARSPAVAFDNSSLSSTGAGGDPRAHPRSRDRARPAIRRPALQNRLAQGLLSRRRHGPGRGWRQLTLANAASSACPQKQNQHNTIRTLNVSQFAIAFVTVVLSGSAYAHGPSTDSRRPTGRASSGAERRSVDLQDALSQLSRGANDHGATGGGEIVLAAGRVKRAVSSVKEGAKHKWNSVKKGASNLTGKRVKGAGKHSTAAGL